ncbi:unnamed protein product [Protopolystoma xenopodis]|uniref:Uncharacterized protein n=1 Tax=Protopolystoma xenopodis TaxID=117903 RepID=A0A3S5A6V5_9PLAT|nr:unnamed protein product [Protopolystoma xenopodis]
MHEHRSSLGSDASVNLKDDRNVLFVIQGKKGSSAFLHQRLCLKLGTGPRRMRHIEGGDEGEDNRVMGLKPRERKIPRHLHVHGGEYSLL